MGERPILFSAPMVRAILAGAKTQTRRVAKELPGAPGLHSSKTAGCTWNGDVVCPALVRHDPAGPNAVSTLTWPFRGCRYGEPGDRLWVKETWAEVPRTAGHEGAVNPHDPHFAVRYRATWDRTHSSRWRPSIHMPRWASRITLEITSVRVERVQAISLDDARAEGIPQMHGEAAALGLSPVRTASTVAPDERDHWDNSTSRENFARLWDTINGAKAPWSANPWVWVVEFKRVEVPHA
jgi:hypothetical protein